MYGGYHGCEDVEVLMQEIVSEISMDILEAVPGVVTLGMTAGCFVVLAPALLVGCFRALIYMMEGR